MHAPRDKLPTLDGRLDVDKVVWANILRRRAFDNLEVAQRRKLNREILQRLGRLVDQKHVENNVELVNLLLSACGLQSASNSCITLTYASAYTESEKPVSCTTRLSFDVRSSVALSPPVARSKSWSISSIPSASFFLSWRMLNESSTLTADFALSEASLAARFFSSVCTMVRNDFRVSSRNTVWISFLCANSDSERTHDMIRSIESSSINVLTKCDWPTRIMEIIISMASARRAFVRAVS